MTIYRQLTMRPLLALALLLATSAAAGETQTKASLVLKLPSAWGRIAADAAENERSQVAPLFDGVSVVVQRPTLESNGSDIFSAPSDGVRPAWMLRGWFSPDGSVTRLEDMGLPVNSWSLDSWRFDALVIRTF